MLLRRGKAPFGSADLSAEPTQGRKKTIDRREIFFFRRGAAPIVVERSSLVMKSSVYGSLLT